MLDRKLPVNYLAIPRQNSEWKVTGKAFEDDASFGEVRKPSRTNPTATNLPEKMSDSTLCSDMSASDQSKGERI
jgi:hypothetical protein